MTPTDHPLAGPATALKYLILVGGAFIMVFPSSG